MHTPAVPSRDEAPGRRTCTECNRETVVDHHTKCTRCLAAHKEALDRRRAAALRMPQITCSGSLEVEEVSA